jgi:acyl-CoA reductase-like NAD-dependent aldehyde dehydrogenase
VRSLAPALAAGCTAIVKAAAQTPLVIAAMLRCFEQTTLPKGAVNLVNEVGYAAGERLVESHDVDVVSFTGSTATGKKIVAAAAESMKKLSLELGGKSCCVVFEDADIAAIAPRIARAECEKVPEPPSPTASASSRDYRQILHDPDDYPAM